MTRLRWTYRAAEHLLQIRELKHRQHVVRAIRGLRLFPRQGRVPPEVRRHPDMKISVEVREIIFPRLARVFYRYDEDRDTVYVLGIIFRGESVTLDRLNRLLQD